MRVKLYRKIHNLAATAIANLLIKKFQLATMSSEISWTTYIQYLENQGLKNYEYIAWACMSFI